MYLLKYIKKHPLGFWLMLAFMYIGTIQSQDYHFTQFFANKLYLGPSFAGATAQNRVISNYRNQWPGLPKGYATYSLSFDHYFHNFNSGLGFLVMRDVAGTGKLGTLHMGLYYSYDFNVNRTFHLRPGVSFNYLQRTVDYSKFTFYDMMIDPNKGATNEVFPKDNIGNIDASASLVAYTSKFTIGATCDHLLQPNMSLTGDVDKYLMKYSVYGVLTILRQGRLLKPVDETLSLAFMFKNMKDYRQLDLGVYWAQSPLTFGLWYRGIPVVNSDRGDSFAALVGYKSPNFSIGYSYDFTISNLIKSSDGAHEISLAIEFEKQKRRRRLHAVPCPEF